LWLIVNATEQQPTMTPPPTPEFVPPVHGTLQIAADTTAEQLLIAQQQLKAQHQQAVQTARAMAEQAAIKQAMDHLLKYVDLQQDFDRHAGMALGMIYLSIDPALKPLVANLKSPTEAYKAICSRYKTNEMSQLIHYHSELFALKMEANTDLHTHFNWINTLIQWITLIDTTLLEAMIAMFTISSLPTQFNAIKPVVQMWDAINNNKLHTILLQHNLLSQEPPALKESLLLSRVHDGQQLSKSKDRSNSDQHNHQVDHSIAQKKKVQCSHCQNTRHMWKECHKRLQGELAALKGGHHSNTTQDVLLVSGCATADEHNVWFLNTGATSHMMCNLAWLHDYKPLPINWVTLSNNAVINAVGTSTICGFTTINGRNMPLMLVGVLHIPQLEKKEELDLAKPHH
jgi:hypothetical protein